ncbi:MAG: UDP-N-acetylmuramate--L-alanine ligase [Flavobacteriaceae bacterium]
MKTNTYYFIGIGGIGMSSIARFLLQQGNRVGGYDRTPSTLTQALQQQGATITYSDLQSAIPEAFRGKETCVIFTPAVPNDHPQKHYFKAQGNKLLKRAVFLGELTQNRATLAVAGTHGKTTTTSILAHVLLSLEVPFTAFIGGVTNAQKSNLISTGTDLILVEADEFDRSFLQLSPSIACITSTDADHLDIYGTKEEVTASYRAFADKVQEKLIVAKGIAIEGLTYSIEEEADYFVSDIHLEGFGYRFNLHSLKGVYEEVYFSQLGLHNLSNALAAFAVASQYGIDEVAMVKTLANFKGVERRLQLVFQNEEHVLIDDYAHHPTEIEAVFHTLENAYPEDGKCVIFQPHLFTRTKDFLLEFAAALALFDRVILVPIYPAREEPIKGISSEVLATKIGTRTSVNVIDKESLGEQIKTVDQKIKVVLGAGDIGLELKELKENLLNNEAN